MNPSPSDYRHDDEEDDDDPGSSVECDVVALPHPFDFTDLSSIDRAAGWVESDYGGVLDVLVNNAVVCYNDPTLYGRTRFTPFVEQAGVTVDTNYRGTLRVAESFLPLLKRSDSPRMINIVSYAGRLTILRSRHLMEEFTSETLTIPRLSELMDRFVGCVEDGTREREGWPNTCYGMSKLGVIALTRVMARERPGMMINSVDPGYCRTDQNNNMGTVDPARGARTAHLLALMERGGDGGGAGVEEYDDEDDDGREEGGGDVDDDDVKVDDDDAGDDEEVEVDSGLHFYEESEISWTYQS